MSVLKILPGKEVHLCNAHTGKEVHLVSFCSIIFQLSIYNKRGKEKQEIDQQVSHEEAESLLELEIDELLNHIL